MPSLNKNNAEKIQNDIKRLLQDLQQSSNLVFCSECDLAIQHNEGEYAGFTFCRHWLKYFISKGDFCSHGIRRRESEDTNHEAEKAAVSEEAFTEIKKFFDSEGIPYQGTNYPDTIRFRAYGTSYTLQNTDKGIVFCCKTYPTTELLIKAIEKECRGGDGTFGL